MSPLVKYMDISELYTGNSYQVMVQILKLVEYYLPKFAAVKRRQQICSSLEEKNKTDTSFIFRQTENKMISICKLWLGISSLIIITIMPFALLLKNLICCDIF